jgi:hypothetical protein
MRVMTKKGLLIALAFLLIAPNILGQSNSPAKVLSDSIRRVVFDGEAFFGEGQAMPRWSNGYLVARRAETFQAGVPHIRVYDQNGNRVRKAAVWFPESQRILIYSVAINPSGQIVAGGAANVEMKYGEASPHVYGVAAPPQMKLLGFATTSHEQVYGYFSQGDFGVSGL